ncbi:hypothetical protein JYT44_02725 [Caldithrix abyssi]|nr:hypothetical protein [Caldithrix abyssi]
MPKIKEIDNMQGVVKLQDGTAWKIKPLHKLRTAIWIGFDSIEIIPSTNIMYPKILVNTQRVECAEAKPAQ